MASFKVQSEHERRALAFSKRFAYTIQCSKQYLSQVHDNSEFTLCKIESYINLCYGHLQTINNGSAEGLFGPMEDHHALDSVYSELIDVIASLQEKHNHLKVSITPNNMDGSVKKNSTTTDETAIFQKHQKEYALNVFAVCQRFGYKLECAKQYISLVDENQHQSLWEIDRYLSLCKCQLETLQQKKAEKLFGPLGDHTDITTLETELIAMINLLENKYKELKTNEVSSIIEPTMVQSEYKRKVFEVSKRFGYTLKCSKQYLAQKDENPNCLFKVGIYLNLCKSHLQILQHERAEKLYGPLGDHNDITNLESELICTIDLLQKKYNDLKDREVPNNLDVLENERSTTADENLTSECLSKVQI